MRKRSNYRPKPVMRDPVGWVVAGLKPIALAREEMTLLGIKNHGAIEAIRTGQATRAQVDFLVNALNIANALAVRGQGIDWLPEIETAQEAIRAACRRPKFLFTGTELAAVNTAIEVHDAQLRDPKTTVHMLEQAIVSLKRMQAAGKAERLRFPEEQTA